MRLAVTLDVEADGQWDYGVPLRTRNVAYWQRFQHICERHGVRPTYLVASEIAADERARGLLTDWLCRGAVEVGAHLHPWSTPPYSSRSGLRYNDAIHAFPSQLPEDLLREKTVNLTEEIEAAVGVRPQSYRAGRFGLDLRGVRILSELGYRVDSSVTPLQSWAGFPGMDGQGGPDFREHTPYPFRIAGSGDPGLLELPVTVICTYSVLRRIPLLLEAYRSLPVRAVRKLFLNAWLRPQPLWLTGDPKYVPEDLAAVWRCAEIGGLDVAVMMFHSSELMPGGSPFRPDDNAVVRLLALLDTFFGFVRSSGGGFVTLTEAADRLTEAGGRVESRPL